MNNNVTPASSVLARMSSQYMSDLSTPRAGYPKVHVDVLRGISRNSFQVTE